MLAIAGSAPARAAVVPGATYNGRASDEGIVQFTVSPDGSSLSAYSITNVEGNTCEFSANGGAGSWSTPITSGAFDYQLGSAFTFQGTFPATQTASGTFQFTNPAQPGVAACSTGTISWTALTTDNPPAVTGNPGEASVPAGQPLTGANCQDTDGKISGRGSTLQLWLQYGLASGYANDVCGTVGPDTAAYFDGSIPDSVGDPTDPDSYNGATFIGPSQKTNSPGQAGQDWMVAYNDYSAQNTGATGSSNGETAISCRTDAFAGSDVPYLMNDYNTINGTPGGESAVTGQACYPMSAGDTYTSPFQAINVNVANDPQGPPSGPGNGLMSFPIAASAVELAANLTKANCDDTTTPATLKLSALDVSNLLGGIDTNWEDLDKSINGANDAGENPTLASCNEAVVRVVRNDTSGTTQATLDYLKDADSADAVCTTANPSNSSWAKMQADLQTSGDLNNDIWPGEAGTAGQPAAATVWPAIGTTAGCSGITQAGAPGGPSLLQVLHNQPGAVGYVDLSDIRHDTSTSAGSGYSATLVGSELANSSSTPSSETYVYPGQVQFSGASNCSLTGASLPGGGTADDVGLFGDWALDSPDNTDDVAYGAEGSSYPICGLTWDLIWGGEDGNTVAVAPEPELDEDQVRTLYSYFTYVLSDYGQARAAAAGYASLPESVLVQLRAAFQSYF